MVDIKDMVFTTKSIMATQKQKDTINDLLDQVVDFGYDDYKDVDVEKLSKQDATILIRDLINIVNQDEFAFADWYEYEVID